MDLFDTNDKVIAIVDDEHSFVAIYVDCTNDGRHIVKLDGCDGFLIVNDVKHLKTR